MFKLLAIFLSFSPITVKGSPIEEVISGNSGALLAIIEADPSLVNADDGTSKTLLINAAWFGSSLQTDVVRVLLSKNADVNRVDSSGCSALIYASARGNAEIVRMLIEAKAKVNHADNFRETALIRAAYGGHNKVFEILIANNADVNKVDQDGDTPLTRAVRRGHADIVRILIGHRADVNHANNGRNTPLILACFAPVQINVVKILIESRADLNRVNKAGKSALSLAVAAKYFELVYLLVLNGVDVWGYSTNDLVKRAIAEMKSRFFIVSSFAKALPHEDGSLLEFVEETIQSVM